MEEVDQIILHSFLNIGCEFAEGLKSLKQLTTEDVIEASVKCIRTINPDFKMSHIMPPGMSARFRVGSAIAQACQNVGYRDSIGYETFLYSSESDIRKIFMFLVEKLPRKEGVKEDEVEATSVLKRRIGQVLREQCGTLWMPAYCKEDQKSVQFITENVHVPAFSKKNKIDADKTLFIYEQISHHDRLVPSILELNANGLAQSSAVLIQKEVSGKKVLKESFQWKQRCLVPDDLSLSSSFDEVIQVVSGQSKQSKQSRFAHAKKLQFTSTEPTFQNVSAVRPSVPKKPKHLSRERTNDNATKLESSTLLPEEMATTREIVEEQVEDGKEITVETEEERFEREENELKEVISQADQQQESNRDEIRNVEAKIKQMKLEIGELDSTIDEEKQQINLKEKTVHLLPNAEENIEKLKALVEKNSQRLIGLGKLWEERRVPLIEEIRELKQRGSASQVDTESKLEEIKTLRKRMKEASEETKKKEQLMKQLTTELESMKRDVSRQSYTKRILEIVSSIHKQQLQIQRVIADTRAVQKQINQMRGRIDRTFTAADEIIFKDAKKDVNVKQAYKYLVSLHDNCNALIQTVEATGAIMREIRDLEDQINAETKKNAEENLAKIMKDFKEMKKENAILMKQLKER
ncbi:unnamed protein product [Clavelina lepadiformis]|uniref:Coiled-coil domain-containing protein 22 n=1 Tax=Clavelina lepadiformis TaxID=159417 RepID=A0ABP0H108_CLALP